jgi:hypothetical protein
MAFVSYISFAEYQALGGTVSQADFTNLERKAQRQLDYYTFNRIQKLTSVPDEVKEVLTEYINMMYNNNVLNASASSASSYSNGVESIVFKDDASSQFNNELVKIAVDWLPLYLTTRSVGFDINKYLQSDNNNPE